MEYVRFGSAGVKVSRIALGTSLRGQADEAAAERMVHRALDRGVNLFDCANVYSPGGDRASREAGVAYAVNAGRSEEVLGRALKGRRDDVVITCKVYQPVGPGPNDSGASRYHILREIERSLRRLQTDHVDVYFLHRFDPETPLEESLRAMEAVVQQGKARYIGVSQYQAWQVMRALGIQERINAAPLITVQNPYSLLDRRLEAEMLPLLAPPWPRWGCGGCSPTPRSPRPSRAPTPPSSSTRTWARSASPSRPRTCSASTTFPAASA